MSERVVSNAPPLPPPNDPNVIISHAGEQIEEAANLLQNSSRLEALNSILGADDRGPLAETAKEQLIVAPRNYKVALLYRLTVCGRNGQCGNLERC